MCVNKLYNIVARYFRSVHENFLPQRKIMVRVYYSIFIPWLESGLWLRLGHYFNLHLKELMMHLYDG